MVKGQATLDGFTGATPNKGTKRNADGQSVIESSPKRAKTTSTAASTSRKAQGAANAKGDLGTKYTAKELADDGETPYDELLRTIEEGSKDKIEPKGDVVVHWMRMKDLRIQDNRGLSFASVEARKANKHLMVLFVLSPNDYKAHHRAARRIDFTLRNLACLQKELADLNIPLHVITLTPRKTIPDKVVELLQEIGASHVYGNIEHEVDEARQLTATYTLCKKAGIQANWVHDGCVVPPGELLTKQGKPYSVYSPWYRTWSAAVLKDPSKYLDEAAAPEANDESARKHEKIGPFFQTEIPTELEGFTLPEEDAKNMAQLWPAGHSAATESLHKFVKAKGDQIEAKQDPSKGGKEEAQMADDGMQVLINGYSDGRSRVDQPNTSRMSPYLSAGVISVRQCVNATLALSKNKLNVDKKTSIGVWVSEVAWRDFYQHILAAFPRVCMGHAFQQHLDGVVWEDPSEHLQAWKDGRTGYPLVDAGIRQMKLEGWCHNRARMNIASFLTKHLMLDWRLGERYFMENLLDGDFGANNGGWQWCSSTGSDPQPYFRVFAPTTQSEKFDPDGAYIKRYIPELAKMSGKAIHEPSKTKSKAELEKMGYCMPIVEHKFARKRAIARFKNPGEAVDE